MNHFGEQSGKTWNSRRFILIFGQKVVGPHGIFIENGAWFSNSGFQFFVNSIFHSAVATICTPPTSFYLLRFDPAYITAFNNLQHTSVALFKWCQVFWNQIKSLFYHLPPFLKTGLLSSLAVILNMWNGCQGNRGCFWLSIREKSGKFDLHIGYQPWIDLCLKPIFPDYSWWQSITST